jgi:PKD repeat protein
MILAGVVASLALSLAVAGSAGAMVYCVNEPACSSAGGEDEGSGANSVQTALEAAEKHKNVGAPDQVLIGPGSYVRPEGFSYAGEAVAIRGAGAGSTTLSRSGPEGRTVFALTAAKAGEPSLSGVRIVLPAIKDMSGLSLGGGLVEGVTIESPLAAPSASDLSIEGPAVFSHGTIDDLNGNAVEQRGGEVLYSTIYGGSIGVEASVQAVLRGDVVSGGMPIISYFSNPLTIEDTLVEMGGVANVGVQILANRNGASTAFLRHIAIVGGGQTGVVLGAEEHSATAIVENSIISEAERPISVYAAGSGISANLSAVYSSFDLAASTKQASGGATSSLTGEEMRSTLPSFVSPLTGDYRLAPGSPLIDAGTPSPLGLGELATDLAGDPRIVNGRRDVGPYEYQWRAPAVTASASKAIVEIGKPVSFSGTAASVEAGDSIASYQWSFEDGATVPAGAGAAHAFATPGAHSATLTVKDLAGLSANAVVNVTATSLPVCALAACAGCGATAGARAPCLTGRAVRGLRIEPSAFHAAGRGGVTAARGGAAVSYAVLGGVSLVSFTVKRVLPGSRSASGACVPHRRGMHGRSCTRYSTVASFSRVSPAGGNGFRLTGRAKSRKLAPGRYVLSAHVASDPHGVASAAFRIVR